MPPRPLLAAAGALVLAAACTGADRTGPDADRPALPDGLVTESHGLVYGLAGTDSLIPWTDPGRRHLTLGILVANRSGVPVTIESFEIAEAAGLTVTPELVVIQPVANYQLGSEGRWPPTRQWDPAEERPYGPFELPAGDEEFGTGANVLMHVVLGEPFGYVKGYWVRGTQDGEAFVDFVDTFTAVCAGTDIAEADCYDFANEHSFRPLGEPPDLSATVVPGTTSTFVPRTVPTTAASP